MASGPGLAQETVPEPEDYRHEAYRGPIPEALTGAMVVDTHAAEALWRSGRVAFIDVLPRVKRPANLPEGTLWRVRPRRSIPGAVWAPNVGYGRLAAPIDAYFRDVLTEATGGDADHPVLFFCLEECWMSWNAARRAMGDYGYQRVFWYPEGTDGWMFADLPLETVDPAPGF